MIDKMRFNIHNRPMSCGSYEAEIRKYKLLIGKSGNRWLVAIQENEADNVYVEGGKGSQGFAGRTLEFDLENGEKLSLVAPWHSNAYSLFADTGYDCRDKHLTMGIIALKRQYDYRNGDLYENILHVDDNWVLGRYERIENLAQEFANKYKKTIYYSMLGQGGGISSSKEPIK